LADIEEAGLGFVAEGLTSAERLRRWYASLHPTTVDIVGDFAGHELFVLHGESLIGSCLGRGRVDFDSKSNGRPGTLGNEGFLTSGMLQMDSNFFTPYMRLKSSSTSCTVETATSILSFLTRSPPCQPLRSWACPMLPRPSLCARFSFPICSGR